MGLVRRGRKETDGTVPQSGQVEIKKARAVAARKPRAPKSTATNPKMSKRTQIIDSEDALTRIPTHMHPQLTLIATSNRTPFEKRVWTALCQIPRGCVTTYGLLSAHLGSSPRAVGNALRRNPFAPGVPCHRVVATGGKLGGFKGAWPTDGEGTTIEEKRGLLKEEGVRVVEGRVLGTPWDGWASKG